MKTSIAMTTYNGKEYIRELLDSVRCQTLVPDEVVIVDDCSADGTPELVQEYIKQYRLENWNVICNETNLGWRKNFRVALDKCNGEFVFLCDQDDIWKETKIEEMVSVMERHPDIELLASDYESLNMDSNEDVTIRGNKKGKGSLEQLHFGYGSLSVLRPGCTYCARNSLVRFALDHDMESAPHDAILWGWASIRNGLYIYHKDLIVYRRHSGCASLSSENLSIGKRLKQLEYDIGVEEFFSSACRNNGYDNQSNILSEQITFNRKRMEVIRNKKVFHTAKFVLNNLKHYPTKRNAASDIYIVIGKRKNETV